MTKITVPLVVTYEYSYSQNPNVGTVYYDAKEYCHKVWDGLQWIPITIDGTFDKDDEPSGEFIPPTDEQLEKHPALKRAWEEFLVIKKLLGV